jgi:ubiquinone biosynthesis protein Coq4
MSKTKTVGRSKANQIIFDSYQKAINNRMKAGHDVSKIVTEMKNNIAR